MGSLSIVLLLCVCFLPPNALNQPVPEIVAAWDLEASKSTVAQGTVHVIKYDHALHTQQHSIGTFGYSADETGYLQLQNDSSTVRSRRRTPTGGEYRIVPFENQHLRWHGEQLRDIDDNEKTFAVHKLSDTKSRYFRSPGFNSAHAAINLVNADVIRGPVASETSDWTYSVINESDTGMRVRAVSNASSTCYPPIPSRVIIFQRDPVRPIAMRTMNYASTEETVYIYSDITLSEEMWPDPDMSQYKQAN
jgi:hypothetical protein